MQLKDPNNPELQYNLGVISSDIDDFENSKKYYLRAIELESQIIQMLTLISSFNIKSRTNYFRRDE